MSIARGLTKRMKRSDGERSPTPASPLPARSSTVRTPGKNIDRSQISAPVALVSTTNMLSYNAPDIATLDIEAIRQASPSLASTHSADESDRSISTRSRASSHASRETLTDASSVNSSPTSPAPNHLSGYFAAANKNLRKSASSGNLQRLKETVEEEEPVPAIPERALSHSKRAHERVAHKRSMQNMPRSQSTRTSHQSARASHQSARSSREHRASLDMFKASIQEESHPFGKELEQLSEVVEEFGGVVRDAEMEADLAIIREKNLATFCAADYIAEIQPLFYTRFGIPHTPAPMAWI